jgi:DNA polymerase-3 subunit alpha
MKREDYFAENAKKEGFLDILIRYGSLVQTERAQAQNSLFGMDSMTDAIAQPKVPENVQEWSAIERLNKERDLVGIYLSAHPLDEYRIILEDICSVHLADMQETLDKKEERDVTLGGVVTGTRSGFTKNNKPFGITKLEDFSGTYEIALFGDDWMRFNNYMKEGYFLFIRGRIAPRKYGPDTYELKVGTIDLLPDVKDSLLQSITISIMSEYLNEEIVDNLVTLLKESPGSAEVHIQLRDGEGLYQADLKSKNTRISITNKLIHYIKSLEGVNYKFN